MMTVPFKTRRTVGLLLVIACSCLFVSGCTWNAISPKDATKAQTDLEEANMMVRSKEYEQALPLLDSVLKSGILLPDQAATVYLQRARCNLGLNRLEQAEKDIETASQGAENMVPVHLVRTTYYSKSGNPQKAAEELAAAQAIDPNATVEQ